MAETPEERLARLRREVESTWTPPADPAPPPAPVPTPPAGPAPPPAPPAPAPPAPAPPAPAPAMPRAASPEPQPPSGSRLSAGDADDGWSLTDALGGASLGQWIAIGLLAVGGYLLLLQIVPGISFPGSIGMTVAGVVLLWLHLTHRAGSWGLYAGAVLLAVGTLRVIAGWLPFNVNGETSLGVGLAFLTIGHLRHSQAGGYGWQGALGLVALAWGGLQFVLGLLPGAPGILDLVLPVLILGAGALLLLRTMGKRS